MSDTFKQGLVSKVVWQWVEKAAQPGPQKPSMIFSLVTLGIGLGIGALFYAYFKPVMAIIVWVISSCIFLLSRFAPGMYGAIERGFAIISRYIGIVLTWLLLTPFYYVCFGFGRLMQKITGKDPMTRRFDDEADTYWQDKVAELDEERYRRQF